MSAFGIDNLPFCLFGEPSRPGIRFEDSLVDLKKFAQGVPDSLNELFAEGRELALNLRGNVAAAIREGRSLPLVAVEGQPLHVPFRIPNFVDFYSSREHATNVGRLFRDPANPLPENWLHLPAGYNGRASNVIASGVSVQRPAGQFRDSKGQLVFAPTEQLDFELEIGYFLSPKAPDQLAGFVLLNDWSARDVQRWEYVPLGPFLSKGFATSVSPYLILPEALEMSRVAGPAQDPQPFPHLRVEEPRNYDVALEALLVRDNIETRLTSTNYRYMYWSHGQQLAHLRSAGIRLSTGDLIGSGTISAPYPGGEGSMVERAGPFIEDGDTVIFRGRSGAVDFGELRNQIHACTSC